MANNTYARYKGRLFWILGAFMICIVLLVVQLFRWQIVKSQELQRRALGQWTSSTVVSASRGSIYDRNMELLAVSASSKSLVVQPAQIAKKGNANTTADQLAAILDMDRETIYTRVTNTKYAEQNIKRHLTDEEALAIEALDLPGVVLVDFFATWCKKICSDDFFRFEYITFNNASHNCSCHITCSDKS